jgi:hypothetical protein
VEVLKATFVPEILHFAQAWAVAPLCRQQRLKMVLQEECVEVCTKQSVGVFCKGSLQCVPMRKMSQIFRPPECFSNSKMKQSPVEEVCCGKSGVFSSGPDAAAHCCRASQPPLKRGQSNINSTPHPVSATVAAHLTVQGIQPTSVQNVTSTTGCGVKGI